MAKNYEHITKMENIMVRQEKSVEKLESLLDELDGQQKDYEALIAYYYSDQRNQDLEDEEKHLIPEELHRGVLSEDEIYNLMIEHREAALHMMETALTILKTN